MKTFMDRALANELLDPVAEFFAAIDAWHRTADLVSVYEWLGMSREEYRRVIGPRPDIAAVIAERKASRPLP